MRDSVSGRLLEVDDNGFGKVVVQGKLTSNVKEE